MTWYVDTLDARAGLAFASERVPDLLAPPDLDWDLQPDAITVFIRAPGFLVEPAPNRAVALAAARGSFQFGLFIEEDEAPFDSIDDLREFVRRAYLRASGGDPGPGGETPRRPEGGPPEPEGEPPAAEPPPPEAAEFFRSDYVKLLRRWADDFAAAAAKLDLGKPGQPFEWEIRLEEFRSPLDAGPLSNAAYALLAETLKRAPRPFDPLEDGGAWLRSVTALSLAIDALDLAYGLRLRFRRDPEMIRLAHRLLRSPGEPLGWRSPGGLNLDVLTDHLFSWLERSTWPARRRAGYHVGEDWLDPAERLARLPLPAPLAQLLTGAWAEEEQRSVLHLLSAALASPQMLRPSPVPAPVPDPAWSAAEMVLFAAAVIAGPFTGAESDVAAASAPLSATDRALLQAIGWITANMPERALPAVLEEIVEHDALACAYAPGAGEP